MKSLSSMRMLATVALPLALVACATQPDMRQTGAEVTLPSEVTLRVAVHAPLEILDPIATTAYITRTHGYLVYDTLFALDETGEPQPQMVGDWSVTEDGRVWTFTLRDGLAWHDGTPVTAEDCIASLVRWGKRDGTGQQLMRDTESLVAADPSTIVLTLREPRGMVLESLAKSSANVPFMMPKQLAQTDPYQPLQSSVGSGPYIFQHEGWTPGQPAVYHINTEYVPREEPGSYAAGGKVAASRTIELVHFPTQGEAVEALKQGSVHYFESPATSVVGDLLVSPEVVVATTDPLGNIGMLRFNTLQPPFDNVFVRRAVIFAVQQERFMSAALEDPAYWRTCYSIYPCGTRFENDAGNAVLSLGDADFAKDILRIVRYDGTPVVLLNPVDIEVISAFARTAADTLREIGIPVQVVDMTWAEMLERRNNTGPVSEGGWNLFPTWWLAGDLLDPTAIAFSGDRDTGWVGWLDDQELEVLRREFVLARDPGAQYDIATKVQQQVLGDGAVAILGQFFEPVAFRTNVEGHTSPIQFYWNLWVAE